MGAVGTELTHITCVLEVLILSPTCLAKLFSLSVLTCMSYWLVDRRARSSAKSRSSSWENRVHWMPLDLSAVVLVVIQSMVTRKRIGEMMHPCLTPDCTRNHSVRSFKDLPQNGNQTETFQKCCCIWDGTQPQAQHPPTSTHYYEFTSPPGVWDLLVSDASWRGSKSLSRTFSFTIPGWWNDLPTPIRNTGSLSVFKQQLKTHLFQLYLTTWKK